MREELERQRAVPPELERLIHAIVEGYLQRRLATSSASVDRRLAARRREPPPRLDALELPDPEPEQTSPPPKLKLVRPVDGA